MAFIDNFAKKWLGKRIDVDNYPEGKIYQCVDVPKRYLQELKGTPNGTYGDAIDWWRNTAQRVLKDVERVDSKQVRPGDIAVLHGMAGNSYGHIGLVVRDLNRDNFEILEQNGSGATGQGTGGDAVRLRAIPKTRLAGLLRPKNAVSVKTTTKGIIRPYSWYIRSTPGGKIIGVARQGQVYNIEGIKDGWRKVRYNGNSAWIAANAWA